MQLVQSDPRFMDVFKELTGVDLMDVQEKQMKKKEVDGDAKKKREAEAKVRAEEAARKKQEAEDAALPEEERAKIQNKKEAEALKAQGNDFYKQRKFAEALEYYQQAVDRCPEELTYYSNKAACFFEMKKFEDCIAACDEAVATAAGGGYDYVKMGKALARKANAYVQLEQFDEAITFYQKALLENNDHGIKMGLQKAQKTQREKAASAYVNPEIAEEHRLKGNALFKEAKYPAALKEYDEGVRRNPVAIAIYSNRCATLIKLMDIVTALKDADKCVDLDPNFIKAYARKGTCHHLMKEYHKAMKAFDDGLKLDPTNRECTEGKNKTMATI